MASKILTDLQFLLRTRGYGAYLIPRADACFGEEVRGCDERLRAISGFGGSAGVAVVRASGESLLLVDGRYSTSARELLDGAPWQVLEGSLALALEGLEGRRLAYDPWLFTPDQLAVLANVNLVVEPENLVDLVWQDRPSPISHRETELPLRLAGESSANKCQRMAKACAGRSLLITQPDARAWLLNRRGQDLETTPIQVSFAILRPDGTVQSFAPEARTELLSALAEGEVQYDPATTSCALVEALHDRGHAKACPIQAAKAVKNNAEIDAIRAAHTLDGRAMSAFLAWFADQEQTQLTELDLVHQLAACRQDQAGVGGPSFPTISGSGPNGALPHYRVSEASNRRLADGDLIVLDSGWQYPGATTDITRTLGVGRVSEERRRHFTLVLKGMIALTLQQFPAGTTGHQLDVLARAALWNAGLNYNHGTGHGVGAGLSVHESPPNVSPRARAPAGHWVLKPGMVFSNEPGYYAPGSHGIRCENLMLVVERGPGWLGLETLTKVPFQTHLVIWDLLSTAEAEWLQAYQVEVTA